ncbi:amino acid permease [Streptomyces lavendulae]|uniref:GABA permease n=1 Tax=Streptomyces lavendulae subsp. lavendulae TaxID=58340 RepID=A0A2K8PRA4_STRLA|nr:amino acid permease [Streptomyces lavendulae]ATZ28343.1 GABA permease [Streptomyces lavendulae subsp. lavendulae]QUQ58171.1 GABA permease [Streptomyces lavendulae subsp. lavendulae]
MPVPPTGSAPAPTAPAPTAPAPLPAPPTGAGPPAPGAPGGEGLAGSLRPRHLTMLALGGVIGAGLFVGSGTGLRIAGPAIILSYALAAALALLVMRMLGEMAAAMPAGGSFSVYADRALGRWAGFTAGWLYWAVTAIAIAIELIAAATILHQWMPAVPQWAIALVALGVFTQSNMLSVSSFGEAEFWFAGIKVAAIIAFLALGVAALCGAVPGVDAPGMANLTGRGGFLPQGWNSVVAGLLTVVFAFGGMEVITMAAAESGDPARSVTKAVGSAIWRISLFYLGSIAVIITLLPWDAAVPGRSPYVAVLDRLGIPGAGRLIEVVVLIALLSAMNANLYGASRMAHSLAVRGEAPRLLRRTSGRGAPRPAVAASAAFGFVAIGLDHCWPERILPFLAKAMGGSMLYMWLTVAAAHLVLRRRLERESPHLLVVRTRGFPYLSWLAAAGIVAVLLLMAVDPQARGQLGWSTLLVLVLLAAAGVRALWARRASGR